MRTEALAFIRTEKTCVFAVEMPDQAPHAATVHFVHADEPFQLVILTERGYRKFESFKEKAEVRTAVVIGTNDGAMHTVQMNGIAKVTEDQDLIRRYYEKFTDKDIKNLNENDVFLVFTPTWWRHTDWTLPEGKTSFDSAGNVVRY